MYRIHANIQAFLALVASALALSPASFAQTGTDQTIFNDEGEMVQMDNAQIRQLESEEQSAEQKAAFDQQQDRNYRLYAEKRVQDLEKLKGGDKGDKQLAVLQNWLKADAQVRAQDMATIRSLQRQIMSLQKNQQQVMANLGNDVSAMRQDAQNQEDNTRFSQQMQMNYFNELQTEMGPANWEAPNPNGAYYSMHGMGFSGGRGLW
jgi:hypothetical protein